MRRFILFILLVFPSALLAQEICDNGIDDDGDGMIDLNDTADCNCSAIQDEVASLIPNPSFEDTLCCPSSYSQMHCAESWIQASDATSDYYNLCGHTVIGGTGWNAHAPPVIPLPGGGSGYVGFYNNGDTGWAGRIYKEYIGACLDAPLLAGQDYRISFFLSWAKGRDTFTLSLFGTPTCYDLPWFGTNCPITSNPSGAAWSELGRETVVLPTANIGVDSNNVWKKVTIQFTAPTDIYAVALGPSCDPEIQHQSYYYADGLILAHALAFNHGHITESGKWCSNDLQLHAQVDTVGGSWQWYRSGIALPGENSDVLNLMPYGIEYVYTAVYTLNGACIRMDHQVDTLDPANRVPELLILNNDTVVCEGAVIPIRATGSPGYRYQWSPTLGLSDPHVLNPDITTYRDTSMHYALTASYPGCPDISDSILVKVDSPYQPTYQVEPDAVCAGRPVSFYPGPFKAYLESLEWVLPGNDHRSGSDIQRVFQHAFEHAGTYPVTLQSSFRACPDTSYIDSIRVYPLPEVDLGSDSSLCLHGHAIYLQNLRQAPLNPYHQLWSTGDTTEVLKVVHPGIYTLSVTTEPIGCTTTESIEIKKDCYIDIPNAFTPNGDGNNDYFLPRQLLAKGLNRFYMEVYNRWGQRVFETHRADGSGWDGHFNGKAQPTGVYLYRIKADFKNGRQEQYEGNITLIR